MEEDPMGTVLYQQQDNIVVSFYSSASCQGNHYPERCYVGVLTWRLCQESFLLFCLPKQNM